MPKLLSAASLPAVTAAALSAVSATNAALELNTQDVGEARSSLSIDSGTSVLIVLVVVPMLLAVMLLDLAIFGVFSDSPSNLNRVSRFFFHARNGAQIMRRDFFGKRRRYYASERTDLEKRSIIDFAPVAAHLAAAQEKYAEEE